MKRILIILTVGILFFGLGWWTNEMQQFANGVIADGQRIDSLRKNSIAVLTLDKQTWDKADNNTDNDF